ncbi:unnamed protein product [Porites evermanni]|uniref:G-protein coupled receptors family 1 profile domain-containing protein n=1 Tax=Porites evermanni TaxID=104178 RepID=A0ABN8QUU5_9CNID|nr:unnamed protein product [Porites evermanni]
MQCDPNAGWKEAFGESLSYPEFKLVIYMLFIYIPVLLLVILYSFIFIKLKAQAHPGEHSSNIEQQRQRRNRNVLHMSIAIISVFVFCWLPFITNVLIDNYRSSFMYFSCSFWLYFHVTSYVAAANCAFNPIICFTFSRNYRLVSSFVSIQNLILIAVDRFGAVVFPLRSPLIRSKLCPFFILATWVVAVAVSSPYVFAAKLVENSGRKQCDRNAGWKEAFGEFSSYQDFLVVIYMLFIYIPVLLLVILYSFIFIKLKAQAHPGEHSSNIEQQRQRRNRNVLHMSIAIISVFVFCWLPFITNILIVNYRSSFLYFPVVSGFTIMSPLM